MAWSSGSFTRLYGATGWTDDKNSATNIVSSRHDAHDQDMAEGVNACLTRDNQSKPTSHFLASIASTYNIGSAGVKWLAGYFSGAVNASDFVEPNSSGTFTGTMLGVTGTVQEFFTYRKIHGMASIYLSTVNAVDFTGTSNSGGLAITGLPAAIQTSGGKPAIACWLIDNSVYFQGFAQLNGSSITFYKSDFGSVFASSGFKGLAGGWSIMYPLD